MSYFEDSSERLASLGEKATCCRRALFQGMLSCAKMQNGKAVLHLRTKAAADLAASLSKEVYGSTAELYFGRGQGQILEFSSKKALYMLRDIWGGIEESGILVCENCKKAFLRGIFLAGGHISSPEKGSDRIELTPEDAAYVYELKKFLSEGELGITLAPKLSFRREKPYIYWKDSERIQDLLAYIGDTEAFFEFVNKKFVREVRESANRISNCEANNIRRSVDAAKIQLTAIRALEEQGKITSLSPELQETARLRLDNPELSLQALCNLHTPPLSKGGLNHRLQKLVELADVQQ